MTNTIKRVMVVAMILVSGQGAQAKQSRSYYLKKELKALELIAGQADEPLRELLLGRIENIKYVLVTGELPAQTQDISIEVER